MTDDHPSSLGEEIASSVSHGVGVVAGLAGDRRDPAALAPVRPRRHAVPRRRGVAVRVLDHGLIDPAACVTLGASPLRVAGQLPGTE